MAGDDEGGYSTEKAVVAKAYTWEAVVEHRNQARKCMEVRRSTGREERIKVEVVVG